jgi:hypothetical protein
MICLLPSTDVTQRDGVHRIVDHESERVDWLATVPAQAQMLALASYRPQISLARFLVGRTAPRILSSTPTFNRRMASTETIAVLDASELKDGQM